MAKKTKMYVLGYEGEFDIVFGKSLPVVEESDAHES